MTRPRWAIAAVAAVCAPIVAAVSRAVADGWIPIGDNAYFTIRACDVLTTHHPLLGTWTSASVSLGVDVNNPGPLLFDLHALPAKIDGDIGLAIGVALVNVVCVIGIAVLAWRAGGTKATVAAMVPAAGLAWAMGSELLFDPWQPHSLLFPFLLTLFAAWAACGGDLAALPWLAGAGSLVFQTHLTYAYLIPAVWLAAVASVVRSARRGAAQRAPLRRWSAITLGVLAVCWAQPIIEQLTGDGTGNLTRLADAARSSEGEKMGLGYGSRLMAAIVAVPTWWSRSTFRTTFTYESVRTIPGPRPEVRGVPSAAAAAVGLVAVVIALAAAWLLARRRDDGLLRAAVIVTVAALVGGLYTAVSTPMGVLGVTPHQLRWLWPVSLFLTFTFVLALVRLLPERAGPWLALAAVLVLGAAGVPRVSGSSGPSLDANAIPVVRILDRQLGALEGEGPVLFDVEGLRFAEPYSVAIWAELQRRGVEIRSTDDGIVRQLGPARRAKGDEKLELVLVEGRRALETMPGAERVAFASTLTDDDRRSLTSLTAELAEVIERDGLRLSALGEEAEAVGALPVSPGDGGVYRDPGQVLVAGQLIELVRDELIELPAGDRDLIERWVDLRYRAERETVALFARPLEPDA